MPRPAKKKTRVLAKAKRLGELQAEVEFLAKTLKHKKKLKAWLLTRFEVLTRDLDILEVTAILGATALIKTGINWAESLAVGHVNLLVNITMWLPTALGYFPKDIVAEETQKALDMPQAELVEWVVSFIVAFLIVRHAGELINAGGSILGVAKGLIGIL